VTPRKTATAVIMWMKWAISRAIGVSTVSRPRPRPGPPGSRDHRDRGRRGDRLEAAGEDRYATHHRTVAGVDHHAATRT